MDLVRWRQQAKVRDYTSNSKLSLEDWWHLYERTCHPLMSSWCLGNMPLPASNGRPSSQIGPVAGTPGDVCTGGDVAMLEVAAYLLVQP